MLESKKLDLRMHQFKNERLKYDPSKRKRWFEPGVTHAIIKDLAAQYRARVERRSRPD
jgi:hypothetical protein